MLTCILIYLVTMLFNTKIPSIQTYYLSFITPNNDNVTWLIMAICQGGKLIRKPLQDC